MIFRFVLSLVFWFGVSFAQAAAPTTDGIGNGTGSSVSSKAVSVTTTQTNDIIIISVSTQVDSASAITVSSISGASLTWAKRASQAVNTSCVAGLHNPCSVDGEIWWAFSSGILTGSSITVTLSGTALQVIVGWMGVHGVFDTSVPFDVNASLPAKGSGVATIPQPTSTWSTSATDNLILALNTSGRNSSGWTPCQPATFAGWVNWVTQTLSNALAMDGKVQGYTTLQTGISTKMSTISGSCPAGTAELSGDNWTLIIDALAGNAPVSVASPVLFHSPW